MEIIVIPTQRPILWIKCKGTCLVEVFTVFLLLLAQIIIGAHNDP